MALIHALLRNAIEHPKRLAWIEVDRDDGLREICWEGLAQEVLASAKALQRHGVTRGMHVGILSENRRDAVVVIFALALVGAVNVMFDVRHPDDQIDRLVDLADVKLTLASSEQLARFSESMKSKLLPLEQLTAGSGDVGHSRLSEATVAAAKIADEVTECIMFTSGTTDVPKAVVLTAGNLHSNARGKLKAVPQNSRDRRLMVLPMSHAYARTCDIGTWVLSGSVLSAGTGWQGIQEQGPRVRPTLMNVVPYLAQRIGDFLPGERSNGERSLNDIGLDSLRLLGVGGAALSEADFGRFAGCGITVIQGYGLTESGPVICSSTPEDAAPGVVGHPIADVEVRFDQDRHILCRGPNVMKMYYRDPAATNERIVDGWLRTGDLGELDSQGRLRLLGRMDDTIVLSTGRKLLPYRTERKLDELPQLRSVVVAGDGKPCVIAIAGISSDCGLCDAELLRAMEDRLRGFMPHEIPRAIVRIPGEVLQRPGVLTAKGTLRRAALLQSLRHEIEVAYAKLNLP